MAAGIQVWNAAGVLVLDTTTPLVKFIGKLSVGAAHTGSAKSGTLNVPEFTTYGNNTPFIARADGSLAPSTQADQAVFWISGSVIHWEYPLTDPGTGNINRGNQTVIYGLL